MDKITAAQAIRKLASQYEGMVQAADALERLGSLEQAEKETRARVDDIRAKEATARLELTAAIEEAKKVSTAAAEVLTNANTRADEVRAEAEKTAGSVLDAAERSAKASEQAAIAHSNRIRADAMKTVEEIETIGAEKSKALEKVSADLTSKSAELAEVERKIEEHKQSMRAFVA